MQPVRVVKALDVIMDRGRGDRARWPEGVRDEFDLEGTKETFDGGIVPTVAASTHAADHPVPSEQALIRVAGVLASAIGVMQLRRALPAADGQVPRRNDDLGLECRADGPPYHAPRPEIEQHREIEPALGG